MFECARIKQKPFILGINNQYISLTNKDEWSLVMNLQERVMEFITSEWVTSKELAKLIANKYREDFEKSPYSGDLSALSMALGPALYALARRNRIEHDGTEWPATKHWRRVEPKERTSVQDVAKALTQLNLAKDEEQAIRMLAARTIREHQDEFKILVQKALRLSQESMKIGKEILGLHNAE